MLVSTTTMNLRKAGVHHGNQNIDKQKWNRYKYYRIGRKEGRITGSFQRV
jgi:hypothetical protein